MNEEQNKRFNIVLKYAAVLDVILIIVAQLIPPSALGFFVFLAALLLTIVVVAGIVREILRYIMLGN